MNDYYQHIHLMAKIIILPFKLFLTFHGAKKRERFSCKTISENCLLHQKDLNLIFLKLMPLKEFLTLLKSMILESETKDLELLEYHLNREFNYHEYIQKNEENKQLTNNFMHFLREYFNAKNRNH